MKWFVSTVAFLAVQVVSASPSLTKRASVNDVATLGFATLNGGTTGGAGGPTTTVSTLDALTSAVAGDAKKTVIISGYITGGAIVLVGSNTSVLGRNAGASLLTGIGLRVLNVTNVIIRNVKITKVPAPGDNIGIQSAHQVWVDHVDLSSDRDHDKDFYDGLLDITHGCTGVTVTNSVLHDHWKGSLVGHSDSNGKEDVVITVTYANNYFFNINSRTPSFRFGTGHLFNNVFDNNGDGINTRDGAQLLIENNVWSASKKPIFSTDEGFAVQRGNDLGGVKGTVNDTVAVGTFTSPPYSYSLIATGSVRSAVVGGVGATISF
ncbi:pectate lyase [Pleurotus eryngii]|uniref:Pectate lyase n=1 Tax=Pleurotus eryngii TaxID=5323 RepID=A0A9P6DGG2_PLEER|nr:pectate lyase [Pleurotus eryngii]